MSTLNFLNVEDAAAAIGITTSRVRQLLRSGQLAGVKVNDRAWLIAQSEVDRFRKMEVKTGRPRISERGSRK